MASKTIQMICVALGAIGLIGVIICFTLPEWTVGHYNDVEYHTGLWMTCVKHKTGLQVCRTILDSMMPFKIHAFGALTIISCLLCDLSLLLLIFGSDFTPCGQNQDSKTKMILAAGLVLILAGLLVIIPVSSVALTIKNTPYGVVREVREGTVNLGASIYVGFMAGVMMMLVGGLLCYSIRSRG